MLIKISSITNSGLDSIGVDVEINIADRGLPSFDIVGLANKSVEESKERVRTAISNSGVNFPSKKIMVNLAPADTPKEGSFYDLPIAIGILSSILGFKIPRRSLFFGELSLDGGLRHTKGALLLALFAKKDGYENVFLPKESANEAAVVSGVNVYGVKNLKELVTHIKGNQKMKPFSYKEKEEFQDIEFDMSEIIGQEQTKRASEIAAAGGHNLFMVGTPGSGKTMIAKALSGILPPLNESESLEVTKLYSISGMIPPNGSIITKRPVRSPHHTISSVGLIGGGTKPKPGEISLAHRGVLFLDEFNEFPRSVLEALRQPLEDGYLTISRSRERVNYPARFMLVASANPCPCGYLNHPKKACICSPREVERYRKRISGPILDRIDLHVNTPAVDIKKLSNNKKIESKLETSQIIRNRVQEVRKIQLDRFKNENIRLNSEMKNKQIKKYINLDKNVEQILSLAAVKHNLSARSYFKMIKVARTIADLDGSKKILLEHMAEALQFRPKIYNYDY
jgi:magnesium chelatase family protein